jgi:hypothetical protein
MSTVSFSRFPISWLKELSYEENLDEENLSTVIYDNSQGLQFGGDEFCEGLDSLVLELQSFPEFTVDFTTVDKDNPIVCSNVSLIFTTYEELTDEELVIEWEKKLKEV